MYHQILKFHIFQAQEKRTKVLNQFKNGSLDFVVCTDALARGIDIGYISVFLITSFLGTDWLVIG